MSNENRDTPPHTESTARRVKLDMPSLKADFKSRDVTRWLAGCEDAKESAEWNYGGTIAPVHLIREAGSKMEGEGADWYIDCRDKLKALKSWADFAHEVKARFVNEKTGLAAEHAFFNAHQSGRFSDFVATLTQERSQAGSVDGTPAISDELFKCQLLHRCDELLYLRATASPSFALSKFTVNGLVAYLQTMWEAITLEWMTTGARGMNWRNDQVRQDQGEAAPHSAGTRTPVFDRAATKEKALLEGCCFLCNAHGHIATNCTHKLSTASPTPTAFASRPTPGPRMVAAIRAYEDTGDSTAFVGISSDSEDDDEQLFASQAGGGN
ncbi:BZ3500_MvSof-1268-A1-R1_Chr5-2g08031 [Microbotryum saponariae]|uniref:BZ3500_MvSof-1268-A1-R1_Chr5-2g08031 protein n=1 Tax=Microbotryum saponariae TaxID=289078 RepID=A0A2X0LA34_9BASI|nr:BZ3500_MvSof-1268-A1-R1_Chr5-2g08031 [Microbotryum saponariae]SDA05900.1 BZ3501_MvSof-1269-A2-R1_Chr5-2g07853 [Microbotryum saponariae]